MVKTIEISRYKLQHRNRKGFREGALLRFEEGLGDLHPWPELGDLPLEKQLRLLKEGKATPQTQRALDFARADAEALAQNVALFSGLEIPSSHFLAAPLESLLSADSYDEISAAIAVGFKSLKIKVSPHKCMVENLLELGTLLADTQMKLRLDFNAQLKPAQVESLLASLPQSFLDRVDFIEDPSTFSPVLWESWAKKYLCRLALDRGELSQKCAVESRMDQGTPPFAVVVAKPAIDDSFAIAESATQSLRRVVVTSYLDHPVGQTAAAWVAARIAQRHPFLLETCGLLSHSFYEESDWSLSLQVSGPDWEAPSGAGFGFDRNLVRKLQWTRL